MGTIPVRVVAGLRDSLGLTRAIETGTFEGDSAFELSCLFPHVITIELSETLHEAASARLRSRPNIDCLLGDSRDRLPELVAPDLPTLYFLDGHWCEGPTSGIQDQCPIVGELEALSSGHGDDCIIIDDARFFLSAPPTPYEAGSWPSLVELVNTLQATHPCHHVAIVKDQIFSVPASARAILDDFGRQSLQSALRTKVRMLLGDRFPPWSPTRQKLKRVLRRMSAAMQLSRW